MKKGGRLSNYDELYMHRSVRFDSDKIIHIKHQAFRIAQKSKEMVALSDILTILFTNKVVSCEEKSSN